MRCSFEHIMLHDCNGERMGQNLAWFGSDQIVVEDNVTAHVWRWAHEVSFYDFDSNECSHVCGHYTQIVWQDSTKVGASLHATPTFASHVLALSLGRVRIQVLQAALRSRRRTPARLRCRRRLVSRLRLQKRRSKLQRYGIALKNCVNYFFMDLRTCTGNYLGERPYRISEGVLYDKDSSSCRAWMYCFCHHSVYGMWARARCAKTCTELEELDHNFCKTFA